MVAINIFPWNENFNTGVAIIDEQHKKLVELLNSLASYVAFEAHRPKLAAVFSELTDYTRYHFATEENLWQAYFGDNHCLIEHKSVHESFINDVLRLQALQNTASVEGIIEQIIGFLTSWLACHILESDRYMACVLLAMQTGLPLEQAKRHATEQLHDSRVLIDIILSIYDNLSTNTLQLMRELSMRQSQELRHQEEREQSQQQMALNISLLKTTLESIADALLVVDRQGKWTLHNQQFIDLWQIPAAILNGKDDKAALAYVLEQLINPDAFLDKVNALYASPENTSFDYIYFKDGKIIERYSLPQRLNEHIVGRVWSFRDVTARSLAERAMRQENEKNKMLLRNASDGIHILDTAGNVVEASDAFCQMLGYGYAEVIGMNVSAWDVNFKGDELKKVVANQFSSPVRVQFETRHRRKDGSVFDVEVSGFPLQLDGKAVLFNSSRDISQRKQLELQLQIAATVFESQEGMMVTDAHNKILRVNKAFSAITGYSAEEVIGKNPSLLHSEKQTAYFYASMWRSINSTGQWQGEIWNTRKNGEIYPQYLTITVVKNAAGAITHHVGTLTDITLKRAAAQEIERLAFYDPLTNLPNRRLLQSRLTNALATSQRNHKQGALLFIDLDNFKSLNDTLGHDKGDLLLQQVAQRLLSSMRDSDTVARLGGDEFVVMLEGLSEHSLDVAAQVQVVANKVLAVFNRPFQLTNTHKYLCTASIGITLFNGYQHTEDELLKYADIAMYQAKTLGRNTACFFDPKMQERLATRVSLENELRKAIIAGQFTLYYQVQVDNHLRPLGAEALIRWQHPQR